jgi:hypothetical protein
LKKKKLPRQPSASKHFSGIVAGEKEDFWKGSLSLPFLLCYCFAYFLYFIFACIFLSKIQKISSFIVVIFTSLLLGLLEWVLLRTPSCVTLLAQTIMILSVLLFAPPAPEANFYEIKPALLNLVMKE